MNKAATKPLLFFLFLLSGFSGLIYESIWSHYIKLILGHAAYSQTLVLAIFMGGMALGAWIVSKFSSNLNNPLLWYAIAEVIIGIFGIFFHEEFLFVKDFLFDTALPSIDSPILASLTKWSSAALLLLPQAILLGTTFPLMSAAIIRFDKKHSGRTLGMLYFSNSIGAAIGVLTSSFFLIEKVGLPGTSFTAGLINVFLVLFVVPLARDLKDYQPLNQQNTREKNDNTVVLLLVIAFLTGLASFFYEIGWIRMLSLVLGSSTQAFELMLSVFILGLALGSFFVRNLADTATKSLVLLAWIQIMMGVLATATIPLYSQAFEAMSLLRNALAPTNDGYLFFNFGSQLIAAFIMLPTTFMAGMTLPLLTNSLLREGQGERAIGRIYSANTLGAIVGIILAINLLMPVIGVKGLILTGGVIDILAGVFLLMKFHGRKILRLATSIPLLAAIIAVTVFSLTKFNHSLLASGVYRFGTTSLGENATPVFYKDGKTASIAVIEYGDGSKSIRTNGKTDALINPLANTFSSDEVTMIMAAALPLAFNPNAIDVANIGMGSGLTTHAILASDRIEKIDTVEIEQFMVDGARHFDDRVARSFNDRRSNIHIDDAKSFFSSNGEKYDIIISEPSNPWVSGVASLFTEEFYQHVNRFLKPEGIFTQWLQLYETNVENITSVTRALDAAFTDYRVYNTDNSNILIIASNSGAIDDPNPWIFDQLLLRKELHRVGIESLDDVTIRYLGNKKSLQELFFETKAPTNSDYFPFLSYKAPLSFFKQESAIELSSLHTAPIPLLYWTNNLPPIKRLSQSGKYFPTYEKYSLAKEVIQLSITNATPDKLSFAVRRINDQLTYCQPAHSYDKTLQDSMFAVAVSINPYLSPEELSGFWSRLQNTCSLDSMTTREAQWMELHSAIGNKDLNEVARLGNEILQSRQTFEKHEYHYVLAAILASNISRGTPIASTSALKNFYEFDDYDTAPYYVKYLIGLSLPVKELNPK